MLRTYVHWRVHLCLRTYEQDVTDQAISTNKHRDNLAIYHQDKETVDKQMDNLMEYVFGDVLFREVE